jgi:hypothetical protein
MKNVVLAILLGIGIQMSVVAGSGHDHGKDHKAMHGGLLYQATYDYELVVRDGEVKLFVTDHGKPIELSGATARMTILVGNKKTDIDMVPAGAFFSAKTTLKPEKGAKAVVQMKISGKVSTARFAF